MIAVYPSKTAYQREPNHPWTFPIMIIMLAILFALSSFTDPGDGKQAKDKQDAEIKSLQSQISRIIMPVAMNGEKCAVQYAVFTFILDSTSSQLDTIRFESNMPEKAQDKIRAKLERSVRINWKLFGGNQSLQNKVIKLPVLITNRSTKCGANGTIAGNELSQMLYGMLGTADVTPTLIVRNIYLPLTEIVIVQHPDNDKWSIQNYNL
ncbi:MAG: hypothetical protein EOO04_33425 [Chitinophagaceae bacterium]|nr:MAG: hypothetical protein EOO04_33425 [Chitinophagaceae bacterium]